MKGDDHRLSHHARVSSPSDGDCHPVFLFLNVTALYRKPSVKPNAAHFVEGRNLDATENHSFKPDSGFIQMKREHFGSSSRDASFMLTFSRNRSVMRVRRKEEKTQRGGQTVRERCLLRSCAFPEKERPWPRSPHMR